jgi:hypothetical protein
MQITIKIDIDPRERLGIMRFCGKCVWLNSNETGTSCDLFNEMLDCSYMDDGGDDLKRCEQCLEVDRKIKY